MMDDPLEFLHGGGGRYKCLVVAFHAYTANVEKVM